MAQPRRIGILTGGGDVPGLNSVIKSVTYRASELGLEVVGIRRGWEGLTHVRPGPEGDPECARRLRERARRELPKVAAIAAALDQLERLAAHCAATGVEVSVDLAALGGLHYASGVTFEAFPPRRPRPIAPSGPPRAVRQ